MAETTTAFTACDVVMMIDNDAGVLVDISGSTSSVEVNFDHKIGEYRVFGTEWMKRIACGKDAQITFKAIATTATGEARDIVEKWFHEATGLNKRRSFELYVPTSGTGNTKYSGEAFIKSYKFSADSSSAEPIMYEVELAVDGIVNYTTVA